MERKRFDIKYIGYALFVVAAVIVIGMALNYAKSKRLRNYFLKEVYPHYENYQENDDYLEGCVTVFGNGFYDKTPIHTYVHESEDLTVKFDVYRTRFNTTVQKLFFFNKEYSSDGFLLHIRELKYKGVDVMDLEYTTSGETPTENFFRLVYTFDHEELLIQKPQGESEYATPFTPMSPPIFLESSLKYKDTSGTGTAQLIEFRIDYIGPKPEGENTEVPAPVTIFVANNDETRKNAGEDALYVHDFDITKDKYAFAENEVKGNIPTPEELAAMPSLSYHKLDFSNYNGPIVTAMIVTPLLILVAAYLFFFNKLVIAKVQEKRMARRMAARKAATMQPEESMEAQFEEVDKSVDGEDIVEFDDTPVIEEDSEVIEADHDDVETDELGETLDQEDDKPLN